MDRLRVAAAAEYFWSDTLQLHHAIAGERLWLADAHAAGDRDRRLPGEAISG